MKQQIVAVPNSINDALDAIDQLATLGVLEPASAETLKLLYVWGWNDGFASIRRADANLVFGLRTTELGHALNDLSTRGFLQLRDAGESLAIEVISLAVNAIVAGYGLSWWRYYQVQLDSNTGESDDRP
jgi:hypothetical protein